MRFSKVDAIIIKHYKVEKGFSRAILFKRICQLRISYELFKKLTKLSILRVTRSGRQKVFELKISIM